MPVGMDEAERLQQRIDYWQDLITEHQESQHTSHHAYHPRWAPHRGAPYGVRRGSHLRGGGAGPFRNKTLIVNKSNTDPDMPVDDPSTPKTTSAPVSAQYVSTSGRHKQLINSTIYNRVTQQRSQDMVKTWAARKKEKAAREAARLQAYFANSQAHPDSQHHEVVVNGIRFRTAEGGNKWLNVSHTPVDLIPRTARIGGVTYYRSKHGNLYRAGIVKSKQWVDDDGGWSGWLTACRPRQKSDNLCKTFSSTGSCPHGPNCHFTHDPEKVAICKDYLQQGRCPAGDYCDLSHDPSPHRSPACSFFLRGKCTNEDCRYAHIRVNPGAPVCRDFATAGYCEKGASCLDRHVMECPDYANTGTCNNSKCRLPHVDRAGQLRKAAAPVSGKTLPAEDNPDDGSSSEEADRLDDVDSDEDIFIQGVDGAGHDLTGNNDFIGL